MRPVLRVLCSIAIGAALGLPASLILAGTAGRDAPRCLQACRNIKNACDANCYTTCAALYPNSFEDLYNCQRMCLQACADEERRCASQCGVDRPPVSPSSP